MNLSLSMRNRLILCLFSALLVGFSFPNFLEKTLTPPTAFLAWVALIPLFLSLQGVKPRQGALLGWIFGFAQFGSILYWIAFLEEAQYLSGLAWAALTLFLSLYFLIFGLIYCFVIERLKMSGVFIAPFLWVALEYIRGTQPWGGLPWGELGYSQAPYPPVIVFTSFAGVYGLTFFMVWFNASLAHAWSLYFAHKKEKPAEMGIRSTNVSRFSPRPRLVLLALPLLILALILAAGAIQISRTPLRKVGTAVLLQPSIDQSLKWSKPFENSTYSVLAQLVEQDRENPPDLVVWPETAAPSYLLWSQGALEKVVSIVKRSGAFNLVGCLDMRQDDKRGILAYNAAMYFDPKGRPVGAYQKRHLVPFGEFVPFQKYIKFLGPVVGNLGNLDVGVEYKSFRNAAFSCTPLICYEAIFPADVRKALHTRAEVLVGISNDAWYGKTASAYQHAMMAVVRSAEERRPLLRAANTGISLATDPFGRILVSSGLFERTSVKTDVLVAERNKTLYFRLGNWLPGLCWIVLMTLLAAGFFRKPSGDMPGEKV
jgi:apolipoprotein N-acyltransferase